MSHVLSLTIGYELARIVLPSFVESFARTIPRDEADERIRDFAQRVMERARIRLEVHGREHVPANRAFVYMSNHQSHMDIPVIYATVPARSLRMVAKKELFRIPLWNRVLRIAGFIEIDRGDRAQAMASLDRAAAQIRDGMSMWIAPEGTRSKTGQVGPLKKGGFHLALGTGTPIVPVAIAGTREIMRPGRASMKYDQDVRVVIGAPIAVEGRNIDELVREVEGFLKEHVRR